MNSNDEKPEAKSIHESKENNELKSILILGGTGKTGSRVAQRLTKQGFSIRTGSRSENTVFDWNNQASWKSVLDGVKAVYITYYLDYIGKLYELSGPRAINFAEATEEIDKVCGRVVRYKFISIEQFISELEQVSVPDNLITIKIELFTKVLDGRNSHVTNGVQRAHGREPRDFRDYARSAAKTGVWNVK